MYNRAQIEGAPAVSSSTVPPAPHQTRAVDMTAPLADLPEMLRSARHEWSAAEQLALVIAGLHPIGRQTAP